MIHLFTSPLSRFLIFHLGATSLATVMQMVANGYGITLLPHVAVDVEVRDKRVRLLRFTAQGQFCRARTAHYRDARTHRRTPESWVLGALNAASPSSAGFFSRQQIAGWATATFAWRLTLFDHLVGNCEKLRRYRQAERIGGPQI